MGLQVPMVLPKTRRFTVRVQVKHAAGMGFVGMGVSRTSLICAIPMCHYNYDGSLTVADLFIYVLFISECMFQIVSIEGNSSDFVVCHFFDLGTQASALFIRGLYMAYLTLS